MTNFRNELLPHIGKVAKKIEYYYTKILKEKGFDLSKEQWVMLRILSANNGISQSKVACIANRDKTTTTRLINTMEKKNLIARLPSVDDKRINLLYLTRHGESILEQTEPIIENLTHELQAGFSKHEMDNLINGLKKIQNNINDTDGC